MDKMWKTVRICERFTLQLKNVSTTQNRTFLSNAYRCNEAWKQRLESPLLNKVVAEDFYLQLKQKFNQNTKAHAVDVDILANVVSTESQEIDELVDILYKLRMSAETTNTFDSTHHAVVRCFLEADRIEELISMLHDRLNYGLFPDHFALNILMDSLIKKKDYVSAARVASLLMFQEDTQNPISNIIAIYASHKCIDNFGNWREPEPVVDTSKEIVKVRVGFLRNPYFDDHFDLQKPAHIVGKTLYFFGKHFGDSLGRSYQLIGLILYGKYNAAAHLIKEWTQKGIQQVVYEDAIKIVENELSKIPEGEVNDEVKDFTVALEGFKKCDLVKENLEEAIEKKVREVIAEQADRDISLQLQNFDDWEKKRQSVLNEQLAELDRQERLAKVAAIKKELSEREQLLTFFENEDEIDLTIDSKKPKYTRKPIGKKRKPKSVNENYIPPEMPTRARN
ncbi:uncharacterized protein LOC105685982 [Athalia rosae]|uniref:uncharacterized protein LOC105685982 n=1 Tax=Athalia rosae TaxID=37344 RepID=UPI002033A6D3|nr:uncharacterized protein LOC105685982 [Athalia rosae]